MKQSIIKGAEPLFIRGNRIGFLFIHGFTASPYEGREIAIRLNKQEGWTASVPLLPGHGTSPENLRGLTWKDWYVFTGQKFDELKETCEKIFVCGQSMGGSIALCLAAQYPIDGLISLAGAAFLKDWRLILLPLARHIMTYNHKSKGPDIRNVALKSEVPSYSKYPVRSIDQLLQLLTHTRSELNKVTAPALLIHSRRDRTIHFSNLQYIYDHIASRQKQMVVLQNSYHVISIDVEKQIVFEKIHNFIKSNI
jgi:carboxylesterase